MKGGLYVAILVVLSDVTYVVCDDKIFSNSNVLGQHGKPGNEVENNVSELNKSGEKVNKVNPREENVVQDEKSLTDYVVRPTNESEADSISDVHRNDNEKYTNDDIVRMYQNVEPFNKVIQIWPRNPKGFPTIQDANGNDEIFGVIDVYPLNSTNSSVDHYYCATRAPVEIEDEIILFGTKAWSFPEQDVNLTLSYPTVKRKPSSEQDLEEIKYIITGFKVVLSIDGGYTSGYITSGGVLKDNISIQFINTNITSLFYQFWLYGIPLANSSESHIRTMQYMCN